MTIKNEAMTNWVAGQYSPHLAGRYDSPMYKYGVQSATNVIFRPQGGFFRRPGCKSILTIGYGSNRAIGFKVSPSAAYQLYFEPNGSLKIYDDTTLQKTITHSIPDAGVGIFDMSYVAIRDIMIFTYQNMIPKVLRGPYTTTATGNASTTAFSANFSLFASTAIIVKVAGVTQTLTTHYTISLPTLKGGQYSGATINFVSAPANGAAIEIIRDWEWVDYPSQDGPWEGVNLDKNLKIKVTSGGGATADATNGTYSGTCVLTAVKKKGGAGTWFDDAWVGRKVRIYQTWNNALTTPKLENAWANVTITSLTTTTAVFAASISTEYPLIYVGTGGTDTAAQPDGPWRQWRLSAWYANNYPQRVAFFEGRVIFLKDDKRWFTVAGDLFTLSPDTISGTESNEIYSITADSGIYFQSGQAQSTKPQWVIGHTILHVGTDSGHISISGIGRTAGLSATNIQERKESATSCSAVIPVLGSSIYFVDNLRQNLFKAKYDWQSDSYMPTKVNNFDDEILRPQVRTMVRLTQPFEMIWCVLNDGTVAACTVNETDDVFSWSKLEFSFDVWEIIVSKKDGEREKIYLTDKTGGVYRLGYFRTNNADPYVKIAYLTAQDGATGLYHTETDTVEEEFQTDANTTYAAAASINLNSIGTGKRVVDMTNYQNWVDTSTSTTIAPTNAYEVGKEFFASVVFKPLNQTANAESNLPAVRKISALFFNLWRSLDFKVKMEDSDVAKAVSFRRTGDDPFEPPAIFTGIEQVRGIAGSKQIDVQLKVYQDQCVPLNVNSMVVEYDEE